MTWYTHDCDRCISLGAHNEFDLYFCPQCDDGSVIARYGDNGPSYASWPCAMVERATSSRPDAMLLDSGSCACFVAFALAVAGGHYKVRPKIAVREPSSFNVLTVDGLRTLTVLHHDLELLAGKAGGQYYADIRDRLAGVLEKETWEFTDAEKAAAEKLALFDAKHGTERLLRDAWSELRDLNAQIKTLFEAHDGKVWNPDTELIERLETALRRDDDVRED